MNRRRFTQAIAGAVLGVRAADEVAIGPLLLTGARTNDFNVSQQLDDGTWAPITEAQGRELLAIMQKRKEFAAPMERRIADAITRQPPWYDTAGLVGWGPDA